MPEHPHDSPYIPAGRCNAQKNAFGTLVERGRAPKEKDVVDLVSFGSKPCAEDAGDLLRAGAFGLRLDHHDHGFAPPRPACAADRSPAANIARPQCLGVLLTIVTFALVLMLPRPGSTLAADNRRFLG